MNKLSMNVMRLRKAMYVGIVLLQLTTPTLSCADETVVNKDLPQDISLRRLLQLVKEKSPRYALANVRIESAEADIVAADVLPNPTISYGRYDQAAGRAGTQFDGPSQQAVTVEVPLLIAGQRAARHKAAERKVDAVVTNVEAERNQLLGDAWRLFVHLQTAQQQVDVLKNSLQELEHLYKIIAGKMDAGTASQYDVLRIVQEKNNLSTRLENAQIEVASVTGELSTLLGFPGWKPHALDSLSPIGISANVNKLWQEAQSNNPELETAQREILTADAVEEKAKRERWPMPRVQMGTAFTDKPYGMTSFAGVSVEVPIFDYGQGAMAKAAVEKHSSFLKHELLLISTRQEIERAASVLTNRREVLVKFEQDVLAPVSTLKQMSEDAYSLGKSSLLELLDATRSRTEIKLNHLDLLANEINAEIDTLLVSGMLVNGLDVLKTVAQ